MFRWIESMEYFPTSHAIFDIVYDIINLLRNIIYNGMFKHLLFWSLASATPDLPPLPINSQPNLADCHWGVRDGEYPLRIAAFFVIFSALCDVLYIIKPSLNTTSEFSLKTRPKTDLENLLWNLLLCWKTTLWVINQFTGVWKPNKVMLLFFL